MGETRAVPILVEATRDCAGNRIHEAHLAGTLLAEFGRAGYDALVDMLRNETGPVRHLAANGLLTTNSPEAPISSANCATIPIPSFAKRRRWR